MRRRLACHVLLLSFLKNQRAHLKITKPKNKNKPKKTRFFTTEYDRIVSTFVRLVVKKNLQYKYVLAQTFTTSNILYNNSKIHLRGRLTLLEYNSLIVFSIFATVIIRIRHECYKSFILASRSGATADLYFYKKRQTWINAYLFCNGCLM